MISTGWEKIKCFPGIPNSKPSIDVFRNPFFAFPLFFILFSYFRVASCFFVVSRLFTVISELWMISPAGVLIVVPERILIHTVPCIVLIFCDLRDSLSVLRILPFCPREPRKSPVSGISTSCSLDMICCQRKRSEKGSTTHGVEIFVAASNALFSESKTSISFSGTSREKCIFSFGRVGAGTGVLIFQKGRSSREFTISG